MRVYRSIFNDVLGPIMNGPSSSHSAGCCRIGLATRSLFGKDITHAEIVFEKAGSYPGTYIGQGSNFGFVGGLLGLSPDDEHLRDSIELAKESGYKFSFSEEDLGFLHPNQAEIRVYDEDNNLSMSVMTFSTGGGMFKISRLDEFDVEIDGTQYQYFICGDRSFEDDIQNAVESSGFSAIKSTKSTGRVLFSIYSENDIVNELKQSIDKAQGVHYLRCVKPVVSVIKKEASNPIFFDAKEALTYAEDHKKTLWEIGYDYEESYGNASPQRIDTLLDRVRLAMEKSIVPPDPKITRKYGFLPYKAEQMAKVLPLTKKYDCGILNTAMIAAMAVLENSCAHNIVVAAPTAGSSGVIPAAVIAGGRMLGSTGKEINEALMVAGVIGLFIAHQATFGGEVGACQAEIGSASAMAAASVAHLLGGTIKQCYAAASIALQNMLGLICDPVAGLTEVPCISRNVSGAANAVLSANMVMLGFDSTIPLDEAICTMMQVGSALPDEYRCTCKGGLCVTSTGKQYESAMKTKWTNEGNNW